MTSIDVGRPLDTTQAQPGRDAARRLYEAAAAEVHPAWCVGDPLGCGGVHVAAAVEIPAVDNHGQPATLLVAAKQSPAGRSVELSFDTVDTQRHIAGVDVAQAHVRDVI